MKLSFLLCTIPSPPKTVILGVNVGKHIYT